MGYWGWRPMVLCVFFCVLVVSCTGTQYAAPHNAPTESPPITLQIRERRTLTPTVTPGLPIRATVPATVTGTQTALSPVSPATPTPLPVSVPPPTCYGQRGGGVLCLGEIRSPADVALARVVVRVVILDRDASILGVQDVTLPQRRIPPNSTAAYSALFVPAGLESLVAQFGGVSVRVLRAEVATAAPFTGLSIEDDRSSEQGGRVIISGTLVNNSPLAAQDIRLLVTLYDAADRVTGFRVVELGGLLRGESQTFAVAVAAQNRVQPYRYRVEVEARRDDSR